MDIVEIPVDLVGGQVWYCAAERQQVSIEEGPQDRFRILHVHSEDDDEVLFEGSEERCREWLIRYELRSPRRPLRRRLTDQELQAVALDMVLPIYETAKRALMSQGDLHRATGIAKSTISEILSGRRPPELRSLILLAHALGLEVAVRPKEK